MFKTIHQTNLFWLIISRSLRSFENDFPGCRSFISISVSVRRFFGQLQLQGLQLLHLLVDLEQKFKEYKWPEMIALLAK